MAGGCGGWWWRRRRRRRPMACWLVCEKLKTINHEKNITEMEKRERKTAVCVCFYFLVLAQNNEFILVTRRSQEDRQGPAMWIGSCICQRDMWGFNALRTLFSCLDMCVCGSVCAGANMNCGLLLLFPFFGLILLWCSSVSHNCILFYLLWVLFCFVDNMCLRSSLVYYLWCSGAAEERGSKWRSGQITFIIWIKCWECIEGFPPPQKTPMSHETNKRKSICQKLEKRARR